MRSRASPSRRICPPESCAARRSASSVKSTVARAGRALCHASLLGIPFSQPAYATSSRAVRPGIGVTRCGIQPTLRRRVSRSLCHPAPASPYSIRPLVGSSAVAPRAMRVVFPAPLGPRRTVRPAGTCHENDSKTTVWVLRSGPWLRYAKETPSNLSVPPVTMSPPVADPGWHLRTVHVDRRREA